ncbi:MAG: hypothetical protein ACD_7C00469G0003 [uncultured bacterium]|nr:MAG: hypothetical protein ACD_7C00469G0003 [uncultured bacterium]HBR79783.1 hypothetical protein [Candidatus Moranbacteria bacterium]
MIKGIIFDFGNVICTFDNDIFLKKISSFTNKSIKELDEIIYKSSGLPKKYETGLISSDEFYNEICRLCELTISRADFIEAYSNIFTPIPETFDLIKKLSKKYKLALLSNTSEIDYKYGFKKFDVINFFEVKSLSYLVKEMKPGEKIYRDTLSKLGLAPEECVYIDDIDGYVQVANKLGIYGIQYLTSEKLLEDLKKLGII